MKKTTNTKNVAHKQVRNHKSMPPQNKLTTFIYSVVIVLVVLVVAVLYYILSYNSAKPITVRVSNLNDKSATITWVTQSKSVGYVIYSSKNDFQNNIFDLGKEKAYDDRDMNAAELNNSSDIEITTPGTFGQYHVHSVTLTNLDADTQYFFRVTNGWQIFDFDEEGQRYASYDIPTMTFFNFETLPELTDINEIGVPKPAYGNLLKVDAQSNETPSDDSLVFVQGMKATEDGSPDEQSSTLPLSAVTSGNGSWIVDESNFRYSNGKVVSDLQSGIDYVYVYSIYQNQPPAYGSYLKYGTQDSPAPDLKYSTPGDNALRENSIRENLESSVDSFFGNLKEKVVFKAEAADKAGVGICCLLYLSDKQKAVYDHEGKDTCPSQKCGECYKDTKFSSGGTLCKVEDAGTNISGADCTSKSKPANPLFNKCGSTAPTPTPAPTSGGGNNGGGGKKGGNDKEYKENVTLGAGTCNIPKGKFTAENVDRDAFVALANRGKEFGAAKNGTNLANACYEYVICKAQEGGFNPDLALLLWMHETAASNYTLTPSKLNDIQDLGINSSAIATQNLRDQTNHLFSVRDNTVCNGDKDINGFFSYYVLGDKKCPVNNAVKKYRVDMETEWKWIYAKAKTPLPSGAAGEKKNGLNCDQYWVPNTSNSSATQDTVDLPVSATDSNAFKSFSDLVFKTSASDFIKNDKDDNFVVLFQENGLYDIEFNNYSVKSIPASKDSKYRFYLEKNDILGYQEEGDLLIKMQGTQINVKKDSEVFTYYLKKGINFVSFPFVPVNGKNPLKASDMMKMTNINGIKIVSVTYFADGKWQGGIKASLDGSNNFIGNDFVLKPGVGYVILSNTEMDTKYSLNIPGNKVTTGVPVVLRSGWNLVGVTNFSQVNSSSTLLTSINTLPSTDSDNVTKWDIDASKYVGYQLKEGNVYGNDFKLVNTQSYFVRVNKLSTATPKGIYWGPGTDMSGKAAE